MDEGSGQRLRHLFPHVQLLAGAARLELSELLATPGAAPAILAEEVADLGLPACEQARQGLRRVVERAIGPSQLAGLRTLTLAEVVPLIGACAAGPEAAGYPVRLSAVLTREGATTWASLARLTIAEMTRWTGMGPQALASLVGAAVHAALTIESGPATLTPDAEERGPHSPEATALAVLLHHERAGGGNELAQSLGSLAAGEGPPEVKAAAASLLAAAGRVGDPRLDLLKRVWAAAGDHRDRVVLAHRALRLDRRPSMKELAEALALSEAWVGQIQTRAEQRARDAARLGGPAIAAMVDDVRALIGPVCRLAAVDVALAQLGLPTHDDTRSGLLLWLAGPYQALGDPPAWVTTDPAALRAGVRRALASDGGVRQLNHVTADLEHAGIAAADTDDWLRTQPVVIVEGLVVALSGSAADVAERILSATGRAMTERELAALMPVAHVDAVIGGRTMKDPRFLRVDRDRFELAEWGSAAYREPAPAELFPGAGRGKAPAGRSQLDIEVDAALLRGAGDAVPPACVEALGIPCGGRRTFATRFGPVALNHKAGQATRGSVRPVALAVGAKVGDVLVLEFDAATGHASVELVVAPQSAAS